MRVAKPPVYSLELDEWISKAERARLERERDATIEARLAAAKDDPVAAALLDIDLCVGAIASRLERAVKATRLMVDKSYDEINRVLKKVAGFEATIAELTHPELPLRVVQWPNDPSDPTQGVSQSLQLWVGAAWRDIEIVELPRQPRARWPTAPKTVVNPNLTADRPVPDHLKSPLLPRR